MVQSGDREVVESDLMDHAQNSVEAAPSRDLQQRFSFSDTRIEYRPLYNIAPTQDVVTVTNDGENHGEHMRWGLVPSWAKDASVGNKMINARAKLRP